MIDGEPSSPLVIRIPPAPPSLWKLLGIWILVPFIVAMLWMSMTHGFAAGHPAALVTIQALRLGLLAWAAFFTLRLTLRWHRDRSVRTTLRRRELIDLPHLPTTDAIEQLLYAHCCHESEIRDLRWRDVQLLRRDWSHESLVWISEAVLKATDLDFLDDGLNGSFSRHRPIGSRHYVAMVCAFLVALVPSTCLASTIAGSWSGSLSILVMPIAASVVVAPIVVYVWARSPGGRIEIDDERILLRFGQHCVTIAERDQVVLLFTWAKLPSVVTESEHRVVGWIVRSDASPIAFLID